MIRRTLLLCAIALLSGCAAPPPQDTRPTGPFATIEESAIGGGRSGGTFFYVQGVDGVEPQANIMHASITASFGRGADLQLRTYSQYVPAGRHKLKLTARFAYAAPIQSIFQSGGYKPLDSIVDVDLRDGARYRVTGIMDAYRRELWLEDVATGAVIGSKTIGLANDEASNKAMKDAVYTCCNLRYDGDWISDANWATLPMIPAGARIKVLDYGRNRAQVLIDGRPMRLGLDYGREKQTVQQFVDSLLLQSDPAPTFASWPQRIQDAVKAGKVTVGMSKAQAIASLGPPRLDATDGLNAPKWTYWTFNEDEYVLEWDQHGLLRSVVASDAVKKQVEIGH